MSYHTTDAYGVTRIAPPAHVLERLLAELPEANEEAFPEVSLHHENGHVLTYTLSRRLIWEDPALGDEVRVLDGCEPAETLRRWQLLTTGAVDELKQCEWGPTEEW